MKRNMGRTFSEIRDEAVEFHDSCWHKLWSKLPLWFKISISPFMFLPILIWEFLSYIVFCLPYSALTYLIEYREGS